MTKLQYRVSEEHIDSLLQAATFEEHVFWGKEMVVSIKLENGFAISGRSACVDPSLFDYELGRKYALEDVKNQLWKLEGYYLQCLMATDNQELLPNYAIPQS